MSLIALKDVSHFELQPEVTPIQLLGGENMCVLIISAVTERRICFTADWFAFAGENLQHTLIWSFFFKVLIALVPAYLKGQLMFQGA